MHATTSVRDPGQIPHLTYPNKDVATRQSREIAKGLLLSPEALAQVDHATGTNGQLVRPPSSQPSLSASLRAATGTASRLLDPSGAMQSQRSSKTSNIRSPSNRSSKHFQLPSLTTVERRESAPAKLLHGHFAQLHQLRESKLVVNP